MKKETKRILLKSFFIALGVEVVVLAITLFPMADGFMTHSAVAAANRSFISQILGGFGVLFHLPAAIVGFGIGWLFNLKDYSLFFVPAVQIVFLTLLVFLRYKIYNSLDKDNLHFTKI